MKRLIPVFALVLVAACASSGSKSGTNAYGTEDYSSTKDFGFFIEQINRPVLMRGQDSVDIVFRIAITNNTAVPVALKNIRLVSLGSEPLALGTNTRKYNRTIAPGATENFEFGVLARVTDPGPGGFFPLIVRPEIRTQARDEKERVSEFARRLRVELTNQAYM
jgi:hypothetical protein